MSKQKICLTVVTIALGLIAVFGLIVAGVIAPPVGDDSAWFLKRYASSIVVGLYIEAIAALVPWPFWLKAAIPLFVFWCIAFVASATFPPVNGWCRYLPIGYLRIDTWTLAWPAVALLLAWVRTKIKIPFGLRWLLLVVALAVMCVVVIKMMGNSDQAARTQEFAGMAETETNATTQERLFAVYQSSKWFGQGDASVSAVPYGHASGVSSATAVRFGKVFPIGVLILFGIVFVGLGLIGHWIRDAAGRVFVFIYGLWLCAPALYNLAECNKLVSFFGLGIPFVSFGMTSVLVACIGYGVVCSIVRGCRA